jgi:hypothetical protein
VVKELQRIEAFYGYRSILFHTSTPHPKALSVAPP